MIDKLRSWWKSLRRLERALIVVGLLILLLAANVAVWARGSFGTESVVTQDTTASELERLCVSGCVVLAKHQFEAIGALVQACASPIQALRYP